MRRHIFILGVARSGTTLLKTALTAHPELGSCAYEATCLFDLRDLWRYKSVELPNEQARALMSQNRDLISFYDAVADRLLERTGRRLFVDKLQPGPLRLRYTARFFPEARFVHIIRDGRDAYLSAHKHPNVPQGRSLEVFARYWAKSVQEPSRILPAHRLTELRYEDLASHPEETLRPVMSFLGLEFSPAQLDSDRRVSATSLHKSEIHQNLGRAISPRSVGRFRDELSEQEQARFLDLAGSGLRKYGYA